MKLIKHTLILLLLAFTTQITFAADIPGSLRGGIECDQATINTALAMQTDGWEYIMPRPKSAQAAWGNYDGRTTWWNGYWQNSTRKQSSASTPVQKDGHYIGDNKGFSGWRRGGAPAQPTKLQWLLSKSGGIKP